MTTAYADLYDLAASIAEQFGVSSADVRASLSRNRGLWGRFEDITDEQMDAISRAVWADLNDGCEYPWGR